MFQLILGIVCLHNMPLRIAPEDSRLNLYHLQCHHLALTLTHKMGLKAYASVEHNEGKEYHKNASVRQE
jgi:hypothetical protein